MRSLVLTLIFVSISNAQFGNVQVTLDAQRLKENDRRTTSTLANEVVSFFKVTPWDEEFRDLKIPLNVQIIFEGVADKGSERLYSAQCLFSTGIDQRYFAKLIQFPYAMGQSVVFSPVIFEPLASALEFYGYIVMAGEADTYEQFGGTRFYERAREIALRGLSSQYRRGWSERLELVNLMTKYRETRLAKFHFYDAMAYIDEENLEGANEAFKKMMKNLEDTFFKFPREHYSIIFLTGHAEELSKLPTSISSKKMMLKKLSELDPDNKAKYQLGLDTKSR